MASDQLPGGKNVDRHDQAQGTCSLSLPATAAGQAPEWVHLLPAGTFKPDDDRGPWTLSDAQAVIAASQGQRWVIDYEHQTEHATANGQPAPAAGWIKELQARADGIWGRAEWTARAAAMIEAKEYRYLSPVFSFKKTDGRVLRLDRAGLTNNPALLSLTALAKAHPPKQESLPMTLEELIAKLGAALNLTDQVTGEAICTAITALVKKADEDGQALAALKASLAPKDGETLSVALARQLQPATDMVPRESFDKLSKEVADLKAAGTETAATDKVEKAVASGIVPPAKKAWALALAKSDPQSFDAFVEGTAPVVTPGQQIQNSAKPPAGGSGGLTKDELAICTATGVSPEEFQKTRQAELAQQPGV